MEDSEMFDLFEELADGGEAVLARLVLTIIACIFAHKFLWALIHGRSHADKDAWHAAVGINAAATAILSVIVTCWGALVSGRFLVVVYSGDLPTYAASLVPDFLSNLAFVLGGGVVLSLIRA